MEWLLFSPGWYEIVGKDHVHDDPQPSYEQNGSPATSRNL